MEKNEECWILIGKHYGKFWYGKMHNMSIGQPALVEFEPKYVLNREENQNDIVGFYHTHPNMIAAPSKTDEITMNSWSFCFGKKLMCCIEGVDGLRCYCYSDNNPRKEIYVKRIKNFVVGYAG